MSRIAGLQQTKSPKDIICTEFNVKLNAESNAINVEFCAQKCEVACEVSKLV